MSNPAELLLMSDPKLFMAVVYERDPAKRVGSLHTLDDVMTCEALLFGHSWGIYILEVLWTDPRLAPVDADHDDTS
jgi:hypothetical protein